MKASAILLALALAAGSPFARAQVAQGTSFTFQGVLQQAGVPLNGTPNLEFRLFDSTLAPTGPILTKPNWPVSNGQLTVDLDFGGGVFNGQARYLQITVNGTVLSPLLPISSTPYAIAAQTTIPNSVNGLSVVDGSLTSADIDASMQRRVSGDCTGGNAIRAIDAAGAVTCEPVGSGAGGGDMTAVNTPGGSGLAGGATSGDANLSIAPSGITSAMIANGTIQGADIAAGTITGGLVDPLSVQRRVTGTCLEGSAIRLIDAGGPATCEQVGKIVSVQATSGGGLSAITNAGSVAIAIPNAAVTNAMIAVNAIGATQVQDASLSGAEIIDGSIKSVDVDNAQLQQRVGTACPAGNAIRLIDAAGGVVCEPVSGGGGSGDITAVNTPLVGGLAGGSLSGDVSLAIQTGGVTSAMVADGALTATDLGTNSVGSDEIQVNAVQGAQIVDGSVVGLDIANGTITSTDVNTASVQARVATSCPAGNAIRLIDAAGGVTCEPVSGGGGSGDITEIITAAGSGLAGGAASGAVTLSIAPFSVHSGMLATDSVNTQKIADGGVWGADIQNESLASADIQNESITGADILNGTIGTTEINSAEVQRRVAISCTTGSSIRVINADGTITCEPDTVGSGWDLTGNVGTTPASNFVGTADGAALRIQGATVGVNTPVPLTSLHVRAGGVSVANGTPYSGTIINAERATGDAMISIIGGAGQQRGLIFGESGNTLDGGVFYDYLGTGQMDFRTGGNIIRALLGTVDPDGAGPTGVETTLRLAGTTGSTGYITYDGDANRFSIGRAGCFNCGIVRIDGLLVTEGAGYVEGTLEVGSGNLVLYTGNGFKPGGGSWAVQSDARLKRNVEPLETALDRLLALRGVNFEYLPSDSPLRPAGRHNGFIAQEVQKVFPEWVGEDKDGYLFVAPTGFEALTVEALRDLKAEKDVEVEALRSDNEALRGELAELRGELQAIRANLRSVPHRN